MSVHFVVHEFEGAFATTFLPFADDLPPNMSTDVCLAAATETDSAGEAGATNASALRAAQAGKSDTIGGVLAASE